ncbi:MAG TPA: hypothetical protein VLK25_01495 [Allosphingosinicella sp.]|nr:hypothetical protein [Allosphingosinicella sp.]
MESAVLLIVFNRPLPTKAVFDALREARPPRLYVAADGARPGRADDAENCRAVRELVRQVDWPCALLTLFRDENLGCKRGVSGAIDWFFEHEEEGIILEDDCLPVTGFFPYCDELLARFRDDARIAQICGSTFVRPDEDEPSYRYTKYADIWGWATWRRSWTLRDMEMKDWPAWRDAGGLERLAGSTPAFVDYWTKIFDAQHEGKIDTWDYQWMFTCWRHRLLSVMPSRSQIWNIGWGEDATHTVAGAPAYVRPAEALRFPLRHNDEVRIDPAIEREIARRRYSISAQTEMGLQLKRLPVMGTLGLSLAKWFRDKLRRAG